MKSTTISWNILNEAGGEPVRKSAPEPAAASPRNGEEGPVFDGRTWEENRE